jgi:hypothetical protein
LKPMPLRTCSGGGDLHTTSVDMVDLVDLVDSEGSEDLSVQVEVSLTH